MDKIRLFRSIENKEKDKARKVIQQETEKDLLSNLLICFPLKSARADKK